MTTSNYTKVFKQLNAKPAKKAKFIKHNAPKKRSCGAALRSCQRCGSHRGYIRKYGIGMCRRCFRELAKKIGFSKFD